MKRLTVLALLMLFILPFTGCQYNDQSGMEPATFSGEGTYEIIDHLSSEEFEGRRAGTTGNEKAMEYIKEYFSELGLEPGGDDDSYYQWYEQFELEFITPATLQIRDSQGNTKHDFENRKDFILSRVALPSTNPRFDQTTFMNHSFEIEAPIVIADRESLQKESFFEDSHSLIINPVLNNEAQLLERHRSKISDLMITVSDPVSRFSGDLFRIYLKPRISYLNPRAVDEETPGLMYITKDAYEVIESFSDGDYFLYAKGGIMHRDKEVANVIGRYPSRQKTDKTLLITAHFDHIGVDSTGSINYGALDNASGTATMMEIARVIAENDTQLPFHIEFIAFNGEEDGLRGSFYYADHMDHEPEDLWVINLDMVGSSMIDYLLIDGSDQVSDETLPEILQDLANEANIEYEFKRNSGASDHIPFSLKGSDVILLLDYSVEIFDNYYHNPYDTIEIIDADRLELIGNLVLSTIERLE